MGSSACVSRNEEFPPIRQRELRARRDIMCSLCATASFLSSARGVQFERRRELPQVCSYSRKTHQKCVQCTDISALAFSVNTRELFAPSVSKSGWNIDLGVATNPSNMIPQATIPNIYWFFCSDAHIRRFDTCLCFIAL